MIKCKDVIGSPTCNNCCCFCDKRKSCTLPDRCHEPAEDCDLMIEESEMTDLQVMQNALPDVIQTITEIVRQKKALDEKEKVMKESLREAMERTGIKKFESPDLKFVYVAPTTRTSIDSAKLKKKYPEIAEECSKTSEVSASVRVTLK